MRSAGGMGRGVDLSFTNGLKKLIPDFKTYQEPVDDEKHFDVKSYGNGRARAIEIPYLTDCRKKMDDILGQKINWSADVLDPLD